MDRNLRKSCEKTSLETNSEGILEEEESINLNVENLSKAESTVKQSEVDGCPDWRRVVGADDTIYYYNKLTRETQWDKPVPICSPS